MQNELNLSHQETIDTRRVVGSRARVGRRDASQSEPTIHVDKRNGRIQSIQISCRCGEQIKVVCEYHNE